MTGSTVLDVALGLVLLGYAWSGWRQGVVAAVLGLVGLLTGAFLAVRFAPPLLEEHTGLDTATLLGTLAVVGLVLLCATLGQGLMLAVASRLRDSVRVTGLRLLDSALGGVAVLTAAVLVVWTVAGAVRTGGPQPLRAAVAQSTVVRVVDRLVPPSAARLVEGVTAALDRGGFPRVFEGLGPEPIVAVPPPDEALARHPRIARALDSVIHVQADANRCDQSQVGSGWVLARERVVTNAHVVAGASRVRVRVGGTGPELSARVVVFDPDRDVAVLDVPGLQARPLPRAAELGRGDDAVLAGFPGDEGLWVGAARVRGVLQARGENIYGNPGTMREIYSLRAQVRQGASGGPVLDPAGAVVGMIFATSLDDPQTGYALTLDEMAPVLRVATRTGEPVSTGRCAAG